MFRIPEWRILTENNLILGGKGEAMWIHALQLMSVRKHYSIFLWVLEQKKKHFILLDTIAKDSPEITVSNLSGINFSWMRFVSNENEDETWCGLWPNIKTMFHTFLEIISIFWMKK